MTDMQIVVGLIVACFITGLGIGYIIGLLDARGMVRRALDKLDQKR